MPDFICSLDLGQAGDFSALAIIKRSLVLDAGGLPARNHRGLPAYRHAVAHLERFKLGTPYPAVVASVSETVGRPVLRPRPRLVIDATGVGRPVVDMFLDELRGTLDVHPLTITAGDTVRRDGWGAGVRAYWVPKVELVSAVQAALGTGRLKIARGLKEGEVLKKELMDFRVTVTAAAHETFNAREGAHDDLLLAVAMGVWLGERREIEYRTSGDPDPDSEALTAERAAEERAEKEALEREERAEQERREKEYDPYTDERLWQQT